MWRWLRNIEKSGAVGVMEDAIRRELLLQASEQIGAHHYVEERRESAEDKANRLVVAGLKEAGWPLWSFIKTTSSPVSSQTYSACGRPNQTVNVRPFGS
jgi:hypothetical protein